MTSVPVGSHTLIARRIGYSVEKKPIVVGADREVTLDIALQPGAVALDQVIVTGTAGAQELRSVGNAVSTVDATEVMAKAQPPDISSLLKGSVAGVWNPRAQRTPRLRVRRFRFAGGAASVSRTVRSSTSTAFASTTRRRRDPSESPGGLGGQGCAQSLDVSTTSSPTTSRASR